MPLRNGGPVHVFLSTMLCHKTIYYQYDNRTQVRLRIQKFDHCILKASLDY